MSDNDVNKDEPRTQEPVDASKRDFLKSAAVGVATTAAATAASRTVHANSFREEAARYIPPGQWPSHFALEWYEVPSDDPKVLEVWGYTDKLSCRPADEVAFQFKKTGRSVLCF